METVSTNFIFLGSKITADGDCSHEIKRRLLLGRKVMTNLDSNIKKQRHYFASKGPSSQAMVFPVVIYRYESWTIKKAECRRIDTFELWCWRRLLMSLRLQGDSTSPSKRKSFLNIHWKADAEVETPLKYIGHLMQRTDSFEKTLMLGKIEGRRRRG